MAGNNLLGGLESMGFMGLSGVQLFEEEKKPERANQNAEAAKAPEVTEADYIFDKNVKCAVCGQDFKTKTVKTGKPRLIGSDMDMRPKYAGIDTVKYDAVVCPFCGYAALGRFFPTITPPQQNLVRNNVTPAFRGIQEGGQFYSYEDAIARHKLALLNAVVKRGRASEKAYTCLKIGWLYRGQREEMIEKGTGKPEQIKQLEQDEAEAIQNAYEGFTQALSKEDFPICGMDEPTFEYLLAVLSLNTNHLEEANRYASNVIISRTAKNTLKDKARDLRDSIKQAKNQ